MLDFGEEDSHDIFDLLNSRNIILWGKNPVISSPHLVPVLNDARASKLLIDPVWHKTARLCDAYAQPRPGGDFSLAMAAARLLFERGWTDPGFENYCDNGPVFRALALTHSVQVVRGRGRVAGGGGGRRAPAARGPTAILVGWGMARRVNGGSIVRALDALTAISGNWASRAAASPTTSSAGRRSTHLIKGIRARRAPCWSRSSGRGDGFKDPRSALSGSPRQPGGDAARVGHGRPGAALARFRLRVDAWPTDSTRAATLVLPTTHAARGRDLVARTDTLGRRVAAVAPPRPA